MLSSKGFDLWANSYDESVNLSEESNVYPFAGYKDVLNTIYRMVRTSKSAAVLDIGFGTGVLTNKLYKDGYSVYGFDFSEKMLEIAKTKMPKATLIKHDFTYGMPDLLKGKLFDYIICTYAIHHLQDEQKLTFILELLDYLSPDGKILIGDVAFETKAEYEKCKSENIGAGMTTRYIPRLRCFAVRSATLHLKKFHFARESFASQNEQNSPAFLSFRFSPQTYLPSRVRYGCFYALNHAIMCL
jgi:putative AdoMet-dependent methyltransferase